jgi:hypothetical protein
VAGAASWAGRVEDAARNHLQNLPEVNRSEAGKESFLAMLYRIRLYILRIAPSGARSISGPRLSQSRSCLETIARSCAAGGVRLMLFHAPLNPNVKLYRTPQDRQEHYVFIRNLAAQYHIPVGEFEDSVPSQCWGRILNGPEVLHLGRAGHKMLADLLLNMMAKETSGKWTYAVQ